MTTSTEMTARLLAIAADHGCDATPTDTGIRVAIPRFHSETGESGVDWFEAYDIRSLRVVLGY